MVLSCDIDSHKSTCSLGVGQFFSGAGLLAQFYTGVNMGTGTADKHLGERLGYLWFIAIVAFEHLAVKRSYSIVFGL
jgi:hypothetical protein